MKTNWIKAVNDINHTRYTIPDGWDTREKVAESLQCSPDKVQDLLKPGLQSGDIERQEFPVWDTNRRMTIRVVCYRLASEKREPKEDPRQPSPRDNSQRERVIRALQRNPHAPPSLIAKNNRSSVSFVNSVIQSLQPS